MFYLTNVEEKTSVEENDMLGLHAWFEGQNTYDELSPVGLKTFRLK